MIDKDRVHACECTCHVTLKFHVTAECECGRPITAPGTKRKKPPECPPPDRGPQPGTVNVPQPTPPPRTQATPEPPWAVGRPPKGDPSELSWFTGQIGKIQRKGPSFGPRKDEYLPYLLIRASSGDRGARPLAGTFWESPDIFITPDQDADTAPLKPATTGGLAKANAPNTLYAHVWNIGKAPAYRARVEFYWFNPSLGIARSDANLIGAAWVDLSNRFTLFPDWTPVETSYGQWLSRGCHAVVRCPMTWIPTFENGGHECLVMRVFEPLLDGLSPDQFSAAADRHVAQRNIAVVESSSPADIDLTLSLGYSRYPGEAEVEVQVDAPDSMEWLKLLTGSATPDLSPPTKAVLAGVLPATPAGARSLNVSTLLAACRPALLRPKERFHRGCDPLSVGVHASVDDLKPKEAQVIRVRQRLGGQLIGGYSIVLIGR